MNFDTAIDLSNEDSPIPMIRTSELLELTPVGNIVKVLVRAESAVRNIKTLIANNPYELLDMTDTAKGYTLFIKKCENRIS